ncbi:hypothetical protein [Nonomuraea basaltis]|uniref:hypothetical protein n=1 Tax=Nonomuraea basaltis TaxID=2495887 RepID=UPI00110C5418|nr:hypothetical protein [Nonomuraea basaltis]TMR95404.1 hypothetical protein EJK15_28900 [Nonomuraea basaltis]
MVAETGVITTEHHHGSHQHLIAAFPWRSVPDAVESVDAIVVPTIHHPRRLAQAARLASALGCVLVTLHSHQWSSARVAARLMPPDVRFVAIDIDDVRRLNLPDFSTTALLRATRFARTADLSAKRNTGLILARLMGWGRIVFLDDDIAVGSHEDVGRTAALLNAYDAVGMHIGGFPDNSVVCHAHKRTGGQQDSFVGGGALAVETTRNPSFFPNVYNDDWFYLLDETSLRRLAVTGTVRQREYDPFDRPARARDQEFGDVLAEGVYWILDGAGGGPIKETVTDPQHWAGFLRKRRIFIEDVLCRVRRLPAAQRPVARAMEASLLAALGRLATIEPSLCVDYINAWVEDRRRWADHLVTIPQLFDTAASVKWLAKGSTPPLRWQCSVRSNA